MSLPQLVSPEFTMEIPSTKQKIKFRPFLVKEEKILLMAMESGDQNDVSRTVEQILGNCIIDDIDISKLATFDIEYLFLQLRGKSVGEVIELQLRHTKKDSECKHITQFNLNLDDIKVKGDISDGKIMLDDKIGVKVNYPTYKTISDLLQYNTMKSFYSKSCNRMFFFFFFFFNILTTSCVDSERNRTTLCTRPNPNHRLK